MLSAHGGKLVAELHQFDDKEKEIITPIYVTDKDGEAEFATDAPEDLIEDTFLKRIGLSPTEKARMIGAIEHGNINILLDRAPPKRQEQLKDLYEEVWKHIGDKLKTTIKLQPSSKSFIKFVPPFSASVGQQSAAVGQDRPKWFGHMFVSGPTGSGKSYFINDLVKRIQDRDPKIAVHKFSPLNNKDFNDVKNLTSYVLDESIIDEPFKVKEFIRLLPEKELELKKKAEKGEFVEPEEEDCQLNILIFDDTEGIKHRQVRQAIDDFRDAILNHGRHFSLMGIVVYHNPSSGNATRQMVTDCQYFVTFPRYAPQMTSNFLDKKIGLNKEVRDKIIKLPTRPLVVSKDFPNTFVYDKGIFLL